MTTQNEAIYNALHGALSALSPAELNDLVKAPYEELREDSLSK